MFPKFYEPHILGRLEPSEIDIAYKGYNYGINMNTVSQSQTMFARRVFELMASNTIVISNFSKGLKNYFGDLSICTDDKITLKKDLQKYCENNVTRKKYRLLSLRSVLSQHLYEDRLSYIVEKVFKVDLKPKLDKVLVFSIIESQKQAEKIIRMYDNQSYKNKELLLISDKPIKLNGNYKIISKIEAEVLGDAKFFAFFNYTDFYGENYLLDLLLTTRYETHSIIGKSSYYKYEDGEIRFSNNDTYKMVSKLSPRRSIISHEIINKYGLLKISEIEDLECTDGFAIDEFNYCMNTDDSHPEISDLNICDTGIQLNDLEATLETTSDYDVDTLSNYLIYEPKDILLECPNSDNENISIGYNFAGWYRITSFLDTDKHHYFSFNKLIDITNYVLHETLSITFHGIRNLDLICICVFYDKNKNKVGPLFPAGLNQRVEISIPKESQYIKLGFLPRGNGTSDIKRIVIGNKNLSSNPHLCKSDTLILTNNYPSSQDIYKNMFVHTRVSAYKEKGMSCDVMRMNIFANRCFREYDGINILEGRSKELSEILESGKIKTVCVHFLDMHMWGVLKNYLSDIRLIIWFYGAEVQPWWRRTFNYKNDTDLNAAKADSEKRMEFFREIFNEYKKSNIHFVFVSSYFAEEVMEDYTIQLEKSKYSIIHNPIDTNLFNYEIKDPKLRNKILSIKSFASRIYGNDITTNAIIELSKSPIFKSLEINIYGNGDLFESEAKKLKKFKNVSLYQQFLTHEEISKLHKEHGVFIATTRGDTQGVSRCEAMSSGLVPIANRVAAIPEFVDEDCGILAEGEDYIGVAEAIKRLHYDEALFSRLSENAAKRIRMQTGIDVTIAQEIELIKGL